IETVFTGLPNGIRYGLGIMESRYLGYKAYGHGGDISYSTQALYFPDLDISIVVSDNDARIISWDLIPTVRKLLEIYLDYQSGLTNVESLSKTAIKTIVFPNPFEKELNLSIHSGTSLKDVELHLYSMDGKLIWKNRNDLFIGQNDLNFTMSEILPSGSYALHIVMNDVILDQQLVLKK
ncbi:MAG: T9SS type A sorting domain-containing protein, partial [Bacteroidota bacterium]